MALYCVVSYPSSIIGDILLFLDRLTSVDFISNELAQKKILTIGFSYFYVRLWNMKVTHFYELSPPDRFYYDFISCWLLSVQNHPFLRPR